MTKNIFESNTQLLLTAGIIAGLFFIVLSVIHGLLRPGFNMVRHPASLLLVGDLGWVQIIIFVRTGLLFLAGGIGLRRVLASGIGSRFVAPLFIILGISMAVGGIFTPDPSIGFPPGTRPGVPEEMSTRANDSRLRSRNRLYRVSNRAHHTR